MCILYNKENRKGEFTMSNNENIIDYLYDKKTEDKKFTLEDSELDQLQHEVTIADKAISKFITKRVHPKSRNKLRKLLAEYSNTVFASISKENQLYYKQGYADGIKTIIDSLSAK